MLIIMCCLVLMAGRVQAVTPGHEGSGQAVLRADLQAVIDRSTPQEKIGVIVQFKDQALPELAAAAGSERMERSQRAQQVLKALHQQAERSQANARRFLNQQAALGSSGEVTTLWVINGIYTTATPDVIRALAHFPEVSEIRLNAEYLEEAFEPAPAATNLNNLAFSHITDVWALGYRGQGVVVANLDSGVNYTHPGLASQYRGGTNSWFDPFNQHAWPADSSGHGTATMGVMVGNDGSQQGPGAAPEARWIAAKIFNDQGNSNSLAIHLAFQWVLDPDRNFLTDDAPHVVSSSWTSTSPGCDQEFRLDLIALRAAGILPIFSSGNFGAPYTSTFSPGNLPEAFSVGALNQQYTIWDLSSRGYSECDGSLFPDVVAPGENIYTTHAGGGYTSGTGTSFAAPQVAGGLALLLSAYPDLPVALQEQALLAGAVDMGIPGPDPDYGHGRVDFLSAYRSLFHTTIGTQKVYLPILNGGQQILMQNIDPR